MKRVDLTIDQPGLDRFAELIRATREGRAPDPAAVAAIANAATHLFTRGKARDRLERFGDAMGMLKGQGKGRAPDFTVRAFTSRIGPVGYVIQRERAAIASGVHVKDARAAARRSVSQELDIAPRTLARWISELRADVEMLLDAQVATGELPFEQCRWGTAGHEKST